jgi:hypothetical protein
MDEKNNEHPIFADEKIKKYSKDFDLQTFNAYKKYLLSVDEAGALTLPMTYAYDRICFLRQLEVPRHLRESGYNKDESKKSNVQPSANLGHSKGYKQWYGD